MFSINRPITILMIALALSIFGWESLRHLEISLLPDIEYPQFVIITEYKGGSPEEIEQSITIHLEEALSSLPSLSELVSSSRDGMSIITAQFHWDIDHRFILLRIRGKIDAVYDRLPQGTERPYILDFNPGSLAIMELVLSGESDMTTLGQFARDVLKPRFSQIEGIASAAVSGFPQQTIQIEMDPLNCARLGITADQVIQSIQKNLPTQPISSLVRVGYAEYPLTVEFPLDSPEDLNRIPIENPVNAPVQLKDVARVRTEPLAHHSIVYQDTTQSLLIQLYKESGASTVRATQSSLDLVSELTRTYPGMHISLIRNAGESVQQAITSLKQAIFLGAVMAFLVILLFLQEMRYSLLLIMAIPVSLLFAFNALYLHDISLNIMTLGGLALGLGLIVDNSIVVAESIFSEMRKEPSPKAVYWGVKKVSRAITGSTLTTIAIFVPIVYVKGYAAVLFKQEALTITYTLLISLLTAVFLLPAAYQLFILKRKQPDRLPLKKQQIAKGFSPLGLVFGIFQKGYDTVEQYYHRALLNALNHKKLTIGLLLVLFAAAGISSMFLPKQYWPDVKSNQLEIKVAVPTTIPFDIVKGETEQSIRNLLQLPQVVHVTSRLVDPMDMAAESFQDLIGAPGNYYIYFSILLNGEANLEELDHERFLQQILLPQDNLSIYQQANLAQEVMGQSEKNFIVYFSGESNERVEETAESMGTHLRSFDFWKEVSVEVGGKQVVKSVTLDPQRLALNDFSPDRLAEELYLHTGEKNIGFWEEKLHRIPVIAVWDSAGVKELSQVVNAIQAPGKSMYRPGQIFTVQNVEKVQEIKRVNRRRVTTVQASVPAHKLGEAVERVSDWIRKHPRPGITASVAGESKRIAESFRQLFLAFGMAAIIVYLILAAQFESFIHPLNIILTVPMGLVGAIWGLLIFQQSLNVISFIGIVMLIGISVNDAIIKVDYANYLTRRQNLPVREAILQSSAEKFRPVVMTSLTTIVAMAPMALGFGGRSEMNQPLAVAIIGGLSITTILTLIVTPVLYELGERFRVAKQKQTDG